MMNTVYPSRTRYAVPDARRQARGGLNLIGAVCLIVGMGMSQPIRAEQPAAMMSGTTSIQGSVPGMARADQLPVQWEQMRAARKRHLEERLNVMANRLQITAAQESVWQQYKVARMSLMPEHAQPPKDAMNAAEIARFRADRVKAMAERMTALSSATANLRNALNDNQRQVLDDMAQRFKHRPGHRAHQTFGAQSAHGCFHE